MSRIAIIDDDEITNNQFRDWVRAYDPSVQIDQILKRKAANAAIESNHYDLILLDIELKPDVNAGIGLMKLIARKQTCPVIAVSGLNPDTYEDIMKELDAFDYLVKPATQAQITSAVRSGLRKAADNDEEKIEGGELPEGLVMNPLERKHPEWKGRRLRLAMTAQRILYHLATHRGKSVTFQDLMPYTPYASNTDAIRYHVYKINTAFKEVEPAFDRITSVTLVGYTWRE